MLRSIILAAAILASSTAGYAAAPKPWAYSVLTAVQIFDGKENPTMWSGKNTPKLADSTTIPDALEAMGDLGWELVAITEGGVRDSKFTTYYFKRPK